MRTQLLILTLLLPSCAQLTGKPEGNWLITIDQSSAMCNGEAATDLDEPYQATATTYVLQDGTFVFSLGSLMLTGEATREGFTLDLEQATNYTDPSCVSYVESSSARFNGSFGDDMAMSGRLEVRNLEKATDCYNQNTEDSCTYAYSVSGILLQSTSQDHLNASGGDAGYF